MLGEKLKYHPFGDPPLFYEAPPRQLAPSKMQNDALQNVDWQGVLSVDLYTKTADWRLPIYILEGVDLHFGGCQFTFWRLKLSWECFIEKG